MSDETRFLIRRLDAPPKSLKQGCSCGGAVLAKREFLEVTEAAAPTAPAPHEQAKRDAA